MERIERCDNLKRAVAFLSAIPAGQLHRPFVGFGAAEDTQEAMPHSLYTDDSSMEAMGTYDHTDAEGFVKVLGISAKNLANRQLGS